ncbi:MAG: universal stress protein [Candidatus Dormibacteria bacterium]|jgi:nucleotide-binding universal stress UspA family protein
MTRTPNTISETESQPLPIVVGVDGSEASRKALEWAGREAEVRGQRVLAISSYLIPTLGTAAPGFLFDPADVEELTDYHQKVLATEIAAASQEHPAVQIEGRTVEGSVAQLLTDASERASRRVVGSRGHGGVVGLLLGSVSQHCATHAHCPAVVVRPESQVISLRPAPPE